MAKYLILFGAGASFGSDVLGTPPLGQKLFQALRGFNPPGWGALPASLAAAFEADFEAGMVEIASTHPHAMPVVQRAMAAYFFNFVPRPQNLYVTLAQRLRRVKWDGAIATLNYERLLELSLAASNLQPVVGSPSSPGRSVELVLPHGCCHIFCDSVRGMAAAVSFAGNAVTTDGPVSVIADPVQYNQRINGDAFPPVMSYFEPKKQTTSGASFIRHQREQFRELAQAAPAIAVVGIKVRPTDDHIWGPLGAAPGSVLYCAGPWAAVEYRAWQASVRPRAPDTALDAYFAEALDQICAHVGAS